ncbi:hypothetical protein BOX15_Mlig016918g2 [Macrostomum lignano]|uniref:MARVEL domain-containing protein n=1 Tax=Macrostomum lignano TaxID=282301 RepID=A0A267DM04_9PLAT|nr:hypothetical protein BOX15_Mlig016918g2 [Macrostomum lignano]
MEPPTAAPGCQQPQHMAGNSSNVRFFVIYKEHCLSSLGIFQLTGTALSIILTGVAATAHPSIGVWGLITSVLCFLITAMYFCAHLFGSFAFVRLHWSVIEMISYAVLSLMLLITSVVASCNSGIPGYRALPVAVVSFLSLSVYTVTALFAYHIWRIGGRYRFECSGPVDFGSVAGLGGVGGGNRSDDLAVGHIGDSCCSLEEPEIQWRVLPCSVL